MTIRPSRRIWPWALLVALIALFVVVWWFPARWAWTLVRGDYPFVHVGAVHGSVWHGRAEAVAVSGQRLGTVRWTLDRSALWNRWQGRFDLRGAGVMANGHIARAADGSMVGTRWRFRVPMTRLKAWWPQGMQLGGELDGRVTRVRLVEGWPAELDAVVTWNAARVTDGGRSCRLGTLRSHWSAASGARVLARLRDAGSGPLRLDGRFQATPLGWRIQATLAPRGDNPGLRHLLARLGQPDRAGRIHVRRHAGLTMGRLL